MVDICLFVFLLFLKLIEQVPLRIHMSMYDDIFMFVDNSQYHVHNKYYLYHCTILTC